MDKPIKKINNGLNQIMSGEFNTKIEKLRPIENINHLNSIIDQINKMSSELASVETLKTDFVATLTHDLKVPIIAAANMIDLLNELEKKGVTIAKLTLHVGLGTFRPVEVENILDHKMHSEYYEMNQETADILNQAKSENRRIIAVGTTSTRVLETVMTKYDTFMECRGNTDIFIYPGYTFKAIDCLITNFHLPKSTLLLLVSDIQFVSFL